MADERVADTTLVAIPGPVGPAPATVPGTLPGHGPPGPVAAAADTRAPTRWWANAAVVGLAFLLLLARRPAGILSPTFVAEDGSLFFADQFRSGFQPFDVYNGAIYPVQRGIAAVLSPLPIAWAPTAYYVVSCLVVVLSLSVVLQRRAGSILGSWRWRAALLVVLVLIPGAEVVQGMVTNVHWFMVAGLAVLVGVPPARTRGGRVGEFLGLVALGISGFSAVFVLPLAVWAAIRYRSAVTWWRLIVLFVMAAASLVVSLTSDRPLTDGSLLAILGRAPQTYLTHVGGTLALGENTVFPTTTSGLDGVTLAVGALVVLAVAVLVVVDFRGPSPWWFLAGVGLGTSAFLTAMTSDFKLVEDTFAMGRYFVPAILLTMLIVFRAVGRPGSGWVRALAVGVLVVSAVGAVGDARLNTWGPPAGAAPMTEVQACLERAGSACLVPAYPAEWSFTLPGSQ